ncbi:MAG: hypothetical protein ACK5JF_07365, partial [Oscillospiraceae bacterium]
MEKQKKNKSLLDSKRFLLVASLVFAILAWVIVAGFISPSNSNTISRIPIDYTEGEANYKNQDLQIVSVDLPEYASLKVEGNNSAI